MTITDAGVASAQGLDVSNFQGRFDWQGKASGLSFGIYRMTQGLGQGVNSPDPQAQWNHDHIQGMGLAHGAYHFLDPNLSGSEQARYFVDQHNRIGLASSDMLWLDNENNAGGTASPGSVSAAARDFMNELEVLCPHNPKGVYTFISFAKEGYCAGLGQWASWLAYPAANAPVEPPPWTHWTFWQWGLRNGVDADAFNGTRSQLDGWLASFAAKPPAPHPAPQPAPTPKPAATWTQYEADGKETAAQFASRHGRTLSEVIWEMIQRSGTPGPAQQTFLAEMEAKVGQLVPPQGMRIWG